MNEDKYKDILGRWFGTGSNIKDDVTGVLTNFVGDNKNSEGSSVLGDVKVWKEDYGVVDSTSSEKFCDKTQNGKTGTAYFKNKDSKPAMHYCDKFFQRKSKADYLANNCASISPHIDTDTTTRLYRGANVLHEFMHYQKVGKAQTGKQINDPRYGAYDCYMYKNEKVDGKPVNTALNADTYVFFAMHIWLEVNCKKSFSYPRGTQDN